MREFGTPPSSLEAERAVLAMCLLDNEAIDVAAETLASDDFYSEANASLFELARHMRGNGAPVDTITLRNELVTHGRLAAVGGDEYLLGLTQGQNLTAAFNGQVETYAKIVREKAALRNLRKVCFEVATGAGGAIEEGIPAFLDSSEAKLFAASSLRHGPESSERVGSIARRRYKQLEEAARDGRAPGIQTGLAGLDFMLRGFRGGHLYIIAGQASMGKTALAGTICDRVALRAPAFWWSGEMPREDVTDRLLASHGSVDGNRIRGAELTSEDWGRLAMACNELDTLPIVVDDTPAITLHQLRSKARRARKELGGLGLVVVDYLQLMRSGAKHEKREEEVAAVSRGLKALAGELACAVVAMSALTKEDRAARDKRPHLRDLRESGMIGFDANAVIFLYRDEYYHPESTSDAGVAEIIVAKQRSGPTGTVRARFFPEFTRFDNLEDWREPAPPPPSRLEEKALKKQQRGHLQLVKGAQDDAPHPADTPPTQPTLPGADE